MNTHHLLQRRCAGRVIRHFGGAKLVRHRNGRHELIGGDRTDRIAAVEWTSLFAHGIVFTASGIKTGCR
jgi:hypothetical protein